jgi:hypothetical protein
VYTSVDEGERYKNHSLLVIQSHKGTEGIIDGALDVDSVIPVDGEWHDSKLLLKPRRYKAWRDMN